MITSGYQKIAALCLAIALVAGATAAVGVLMRGSGATATAVSVRGERFEYVTDGVYALNAERVVAEGVGWDYVTLFVAVPLLLASLPGVARGSLRARLVALGILAYLFYQYFMYAVFWSFGPLFLPFILIFAASATAFAWIVSTIDVATLPERFDDRFPARTMAGVAAFMALLLVAMWSGRIAAGYRGDFETAMFLGMPTMTVQAMDLGLIVPISLATAVLAWRRRPWGYLLAPVLAVKGMTMAGAICAMLISAWAVEGSLEVGSFAIFATATLFFGGLAIRILGSVKPAEDEEPAAAGPLAARVGG